jgi:undecaprenyl-diphosphatase
MPGHLTYLQALLVGLLQGVTELFPVSSLGHSILIPALLGGSWQANLNMTGDKSPYLAFLVALHVATALALLIFFWRDWVRVVSGLWTSIRWRRISDANERLAWLLIAGTVPVAVAGLALDHILRTTLGKPTPTAFFLMLNGGILYAGERLRRKDADRRVTAAAPAVVGRYGRGTVYASSTAPGAPPRADDNDPVASDYRIARHSWQDAVFIGAAQIAGLFPGFSRSGATMVAGLRRGLSHEDAARFAFLLATPAILGAAVLKLPELFGPDGQGIGGQVLLGSVASFVGALVSVRFLTKYFETRTLTPFAIYCALAGLVSLFLVAS